MKLKTLIKTISCHVTIRENYADNNLVTCKDFWEVEGAYQNLMNREIHRVSVTTKGDVPSILIILEQE